jgi:hypothetical protein
MTMTVKATTARKAVGQLGLFRETADSPKGADGVADAQRRNPLAFLDELHAGLRRIELEQQLREAQVLYALLNFARTRPESAYIAASVREATPILPKIFRR